VLVDPPAFDLELLGREADGSEHAQPARLADGRDDVSAVAEREDRELDTQTITDRGTHRDSPFLLAP
jgi:hypothetical protein